MPQLNPIPPKKLISILLSLGFSLARSKGSHFFYLHPSGKTTVIPVHTGEDISVGLLKKILRDIEITTKEFEQLRIK